MPKLLCRCGELIRFGQIPCPDEWLFVSDVEYERHSGQVDAELLYEEFRSFLLCRSCGRLWVYWNGYQELPSEYQPANEEPHPGNK